MATTTCGIDGDRCSHPETVDASAPCDSFGPICLPAAYECPCATCGSR